VYNTAALTFTGLPGTQLLIDDTGSTGIVHFTINTDGTVGYDPALEGVLTGAGTSTLTVKGRTITVDTRALPIPSLELDNIAIIKNDAPFTFTGLPGVQSLVDYAGAGAIVHFTINADGTVSYNPALEGILTGAGTQTLTVRGVTVTIDTRPLSEGILLLDDATYTHSDALTTFTGLPGPLYLLDAYGAGALVRFTLNPDGTVTYDPALEGILTGAGTQTLTVRGVSVTVDTRPLSEGILLLDQKITTNKDAPTTFTGLPGLLFLSDYTGGGARVYFTLNADGTVSYDPALEGILTGAGTSTLTVHGVSFTIDTTQQTIPVLDLDSHLFVSNTAPATFVGLPGTLFLWDYAGSGIRFYFTLNPDGTVDYDHSYDDILSGRGTHTLVVRGFHA
jgi:hypothetical protein